MEISGLVDCSRAKFLDVMKSKLLVEDVVSEFTKRPPEIA
jgi:hypothetical protein